MQSEEPNPRQRQILFQVIRHFVQTGEPISSGAIHASGMFAVSAATIRNAMSALERQGFLHQPHTSAGRVPTIQGLKAFVQDVIKAQPFGTAPVALGPGAVRLPQFMTKDLAGKVKQLGAFLSAESHLTSLISLPGVQDTRLRDVHLSLLSDNRILVVVVTEDDRVVQCTTRLSHAMDREGLYRISAHLHRLVTGSTLQEVRRRVAQELEHARRAWREVPHRIALEIGLQAIDAASPETVMVEGKLHMLDYEEVTQDVDRLKHLLALLEEKEQMLALLDGILDVAPQPRVLIGAELDGGLGDTLSLVICGYHRRGEPVGWIGLLGPSRLDYERVIPLVHRAADCLSSSLLGED